MNRNIQSSVVRRASHAGSWYTNDSHKLSCQLRDWLASASVSSRPARAIISPHAGYEYSGPCAAFAYNQIEPQSIKRVFVLGPAHYLSLRGKCGLSNADIFETPIYSLSVDKEVNEELYRTGEFTSLSLDRDEEEHSIEMQMPYIAHIMESRRGMFTVIPIVVGFLTPDQEAVYGRIFSSYLADKQNLFVISSDFCHWGRRFQYTYYDQTKGAIWQSIQDLDETAMKIIERLAATEFTDYLQRFGNTICGRHPISILLRTINSLQGQSPSSQFHLKFIQYAQSEHCQNMNQSSVSYAAAALQII